MVSGKYFHSAEQIRVTKSCLTNSIFPEQNPGDRPCDSSGLLAILAPLNSRCRDFPSVLIHQEYINYDIRLRDETQRLPFILA